MMTIVPRRDRDADDDGFSLVEVIVALGLATVVLLALLSSSIFALQSTVDARRSQQAADYLNLAIENVRGLAFAGATMRTTDLAGDAKIVTQGGVQKYDSGSGLEPIDASASGQVTPHIVTADTSNGRYTTRRYVTVPSTAVVDAVTLQPSVRRLTVEVSYEVRGEVKTRRSSTLMTLTRRGLPLPNYTWKYNGPATIIADVPTSIKNPGNDISYGLVLSNLGARDSWSVTASTAGWSYYQDTDRDGLWSEGLDEPQVITANTGLIEPGAEPVYLVAHRVIGLAENGTTVTTFTARSDALPEFFKVVKTSLTVQSGVITPPVPSPSPTPSATAAPVVCTPGTAVSTAPGAALAIPTTPNAYQLNQLNLYNSAAAGDSATLASSAMGRDTTSLAASICNWSTDLQASQAGRLLVGTADPVAVANPPGSAVARLAEFRFQPANKSQDAYKGEPVVVLYVQCPTGTPSLAVSLLSQVGTAPPVSRATAVLPTPGCSAGAFTRYNVKLPAVDFSIALADRLVLRVTSPSTIRLGYGASGVNSTLNIGMK